MQLSTLLYPPFFNKANTYNASTTATTSKNSIRADIFQRTAIEPRNGMMTIYLGITNISEQMQRNLLNKARNVIEKGSLNNLEMQPCFQIDPVLLQKLSKITAEMLISSSPEKLNLLLHLGFITTMSEEIITKFEKQKTENILSIKWYKPKGVRHFSLGCDITVKTPVLVSLNSKVLFTMPTMQEEPLEQHLINTISDIANKYCPRGFRIMEE